MTTSMDWTPDFCLFCDNQTPGGLYCSQACRLAELEKAGHSEPTTPTDYSRDSHSKTRPSHSHRASTISNFQLQPPVDFSAYRSSTRHSPASSPKSSGLPHQPTYVRPTILGHTTLPRSYSDYHQKPRVLNTSSSRSSLSSVSSTSTTHGMTDQALSQLRVYSESFDHTRDWKRRRTLG